MSPLSGVLDCELIVGNSNPRFSGVTSTMLQTLPHQASIMSVRVMGDHHLYDSSMAISFWQVARFFRKVLPDGRWRIFHARRNDEMIQALLLKFIFRVKVKIVFTSTAQRNHSAFTRWLMSKMDSVISTCEAAASYLSFKPDAIIPHGIQIETYFPVDDRQRLWQSQGMGGERGLAIFGRVREQKGVHHFVNSCIQVLPGRPGYTAIIVGRISVSNESFVNKLKLKIADAGLEGRIRFLGELPFEKIPELFRSVSLVAALSKNEGFGLTVLEAMGSGTAVLATDAGAWREVVREGIDGFVVAPEDQAAITEKLNEMLANPMVLDGMGLHGRERVLDCYTVEREAASLCKFFCSLQ